MHDSTAGESAGATEGKCEVDCEKLFVFVPFIACTIFGVFFTDVPALSATLRQAKELLFERNMV